MSRYAASERQALADLLSSLGPDGPTINAGWLTRDLAAHLVVRERRPDAAVGTVLRPLHGHAERVRRSVAAQPFARLVELVRRPPWWSPVSNPLTDELLNTMEFFIHHEDVRRAQPHWQPRQLSTGLQKALWKRLPVLTRVWLRRFPAALLVQAPGYGEVTGGTGGEALRLTATPSELALFLFGRQRVTQVELAGPPALSDRLRTARFGI